MARSDHDERSVLTESWPEPSEFGCRSQGVELADDLCRIGSRPQRG